jgi:hypothetical protein
MFEHLADTYGVVLRRDLVAAGVDDPAISRLRRAGTLHWLRQGVYAIGDRWRSADARTRHLMLAHGTWRLYDDRVALSHLSAALEFGAPTHDLSLEHAHLTSLLGRGDRIRAAVVHHRGEIRVGDLSRRGGRWITSSVRTALDTAAVARHDGAVCVLDWFLRFGGVGHEELQQHLAARSAWPDHVDLSLKVGLATGLADSVLETLFMLRFGESGLPMPTQQFRVVHPSGRVAGISDFCWEEQRVLGEADGQEKYHRFRRPGETIEAMVVREKRREDAMRELTGYGMVRLIWADLHRWAQTRNRIERMLLRSAA